MGVHLRDIGQEIILGHISGYCEGQVLGMSYAEMYLATILTAICCKEGM